MIDYDNLIKSLKHLRAQYENYLTLDGRSDLDDLEREAIKESVVQRFETCYDTLWKTMKRYLVEELGLPNVPNSPKPIFRLAAENRLLSSNIERWLLYADERTDTSHRYSEEKANEKARKAGAFIADASELLAAMTGSSSKQLFATP